MSTALPCLVSFCAMMFAEGSAIELRYKGSLEQVSRQEANAQVKQFELYCLLEEAAESAKIAFLVDERGGGWAWPEQFGVISLDEKSQPANKVEIRVLYTHEGTPYPLALAQPLFAHADQLNAEAEFTENNLRYEVVRTLKRGNRSCFEVDVFTNIGKRQTLWVEEDTGLIVAMKSKVTMGRGDAFELLMELDTLTEVPAEKLPAVKKPLEALLKLQADLKRRENSFKPELSKEQLAMTASAIDTLTKDAADTPFSSLVNIIRRDLKLQTQRDDDVDALARRIVGKQAPAFALNDLNGKPVDSKDLANQVVVLHFWKYHDNPLTEPYGQVAYLDFLHNKRGKLGVSVLGIAVDPRNDKANEVNLAKRDFKKFREFMNLSYPIALDSGTLLKTLGDPRDVEAALPLWVVIDHKGKVVHYKSGYYEIHPDKGLEELDNVVIPLIRERRAEGIKSTE